MKKIIAILATLILLTTCKKSETAKNKIEREWQVVNYSVDGVDSTKQYNDSCGCIIWFYQDKDGETPFYLCNGIQGWWGINDQGTILTTCYDFYDTIYHNISIYWPIIPCGNFTWNTWQVNTLSDNDLWITTTYKNRKYSIKFNSK